MSCKAHPTCDLWLYHTALPIRSVFAFFYMDFQPKERLFGETACFYTEKVYAILQMPFYWHTLLSHCNHSIFMHNFALGDLSAVLWNWNEVEQAKSEYQLKVKWLFSNCPWLSKTWFSFPPTYLWLSCRFATDSVQQSVLVGPAHLQWIINVLKLLQNANQIGVIFNHFICKYRIVGKIESLLDGYTIHCIHRWWSHRIF